jgi:DNA repair protein RadB
LKVPYAFKVISNEHIAGNEVGAQLMPQSDVISTRCPSLDAILKGGFPFSQLSLVYGEASTGKTTLAIQCSIECASKGLKTLYIDADRSFSHARLSQLAEGHLDKIGESIIMFVPETFSEQTSLIEGIESFITGSTGLIVVDTITSLYRSTLGSTEKVFVQNRELNRQLAYLSEVASMRHVAILLISQVHARPLLQGQQIEPVARRILTYWSKIVLRLAPTTNSAVKIAQLERYHSTNVPFVSCYLKITERGLEKVDD